MIRDAYEMQIIAQHEARRKRRYEKKKRRKEGLIFALLGAALVSLGTILTLYTNLDPYANLFWIIAGITIFIGGLFDVT